MLATYGSQATMPIVQFSPYWAGFAGFLVHHGFLFKQKGQEHMPLMLRESCQGVLLHVLCTLPGCAHSSAAEAILEV
jgi:hypothetical protein